MKKTKVLLLPQHARNTKGGGIMRYCQELTNLFKNDELIEINLVPNLPYYHKFWGAVYNKNELSEAIINSNCDIVHINGFATLGVSQAIKIAKQLGKKIVFTPHWHPFWALKHKILGKLFFNLFIKNPVKYLVDAIITFNNEDTLYFSKLNNSVIKIPHWIRRTTKHNSITLREPNNILLVAGRLNDTTKGIEHIYHLEEGKYNIHVVGEGKIPYRKDITIHSNISDEELDQLYRQASLVVVPSRYESFSYATLEALSLGAPVAISDRVRIGDYLKECPMCKIFKYQDYIGFTKAVSEQIGKQLNIDSSLSPFLPEVAKNSYSKCYSNIFKER